MSVSARSLTLRIDRFFARRRTAVGVIQNGALLLGGCLGQFRLDSKSMKCQLLYVLYLPYNQPLRCSWYDRAPEIVPNRFPIGNSGSTLTRGKKRNPLP